MWRYKTCAVPINKNANLFHVHHQLASFLGSTQRRMGRGAAEGLSRARGKGTSRHICMFMTGRNIDQVLEQEWNSLDRPKLVWELADLHVTFELMPIVLFRGTQGLRPYVVDAQS
eukprot:1157478-Pelagomonas_calceolata.AAC.2